jgi:hypothetical protein
VISWIQTPGLWKLTLFRGKEADAARDTQVGETTDDNEPELSMTRFMRGGTSAAFALRALRRASAVQRKLIKSLSFYRMDSA